MSAAAAWGAPASAPASAPSSTRPTLSLVPTPAARPAPRLRITRRGRLALTFAAIVVIAVVGGLFATRAAFAEDSPVHRVTVPAGSTLSQIAAHELPDRPLAQAVIDLQRANGLASTEVSAGQVLTVPGR